MTTQVGGRSFELHSLLGVGSFGSVKPSMLRNFQPLKKTWGPGGFPVESCWISWELSHFLLGWRWDPSKYERKSAEIPFSGCNSEGKNFWSWIDSRFGAPVAMILGKQLPSRRRTFCFRFKKVELNDEKLWRCWNNGEPIFVKMLICRLRCKVSFHHCYTLLPLIHLWMFFFQEVFFKLLMNLGRSSPGDFDF